MPATPPTKWVPRILKWFAEHQRPMPWRDSPTPYFVWVSEIMLQQTQVATVIPYFDRFIARFPTLAALAAAELDDVFRVWEGLGYYRRAANLHKAAGQLVARGRTVPGSSRELLELPGVGPYTAGAIASIAHGESVPAVDGNAIRVFTRFLGIDTDSTSPAVTQQIHATLDDAMQGHDPSAFNQAVMEIGALICKPKSPRCDDCPLVSWCVAHRKDLTTTIPNRPPCKAVPHHDIAVAVVQRRGRVLIAQRRADQMLGGLWEFPGGKCEKGERPADAAIRELREETGLEGTVIEKTARIPHAYSHFKITLHAFTVHAPKGRATAHSAARIKWVPLADLPAYPFPTANRRLTDILAPEQTV